ncbi:T9SS type B sorting domain-containing protein [Robertkochia marina]|uniref:T9SS type B sorting domain-containing protein n=1 Tax=Robertkochia marina TaxID=1227945 RepID=A0A4S3M081_9FLAO|nr:gliding motility-associated C-terminal domain-containing protein [Robertkochia marina]THD67802.1 T9SS type B sorting domain-containing protein [Robertkochia marina]TRZ41724.1 hypothetical protein D3A96_12790 [Robertkochia marina]
MKKHYFALIVLFLAAVNGYSQTLNQPVLNFSHACISDSFRNFEVAFSFSEKSFSSGNTFYIELSDEQGDFSQAEVLATLSDKNTSFEFTHSLEFATTMAGSGYRIRIRSTVPALTSEPSKPFDAYYVPSEYLVLNNYETSSFCGSEPVLLELDKDVANRYIWFKDGAYYTETELPYLEVNTAGNYYAEPFYGACSGSVVSNIVSVEALDAMQVVLAIPSEIVACSGQEIMLKAENDQPGYTYQWFRNGQPVSAIQTSASDYSFSASGSTLGTYFLEVTNEFGCTITSDPVMISGNEIQVSTIAPLKSVLIGEAIAELKITTNRNDLEISWFKNGAEVAKDINLTQFAAIDEGQYHAVLKDVNGCAMEVYSPTFQVFEPVNFSAEIDFDGSYMACDNTAAILSLNQLTGSLSNGDEISIGEDLYANFDFSWLKEGVATGITGPVIQLDHYTAGGVYTLEVNYKGESYFSVAKEAYIGLEKPNLYLEEVLTCSAPAMLRVDEYQDVIYNWYRDNELVHSGMDAVYSAQAEGVYRVEMEYMGCLSVSEPVEVVPEALNTIEIYPGERIFLVPDKELEVVASGADSYTWLNAEGDILSQEAALHISEDGIYHLRAESGGCVIEKTVEVNYDYVSAIPNVVTPNNDAINDRWVLPGKFLEDPDLEVIICDSYGQPVLRTKSYDNSWPQSMDQIPAQDSNYYYILNKGGKSVQKGVITLLR